MLINRAQIREGETVLILGAASGIGCAAIQIGNLVGAKVIATGSTQEKIKKAEDLGASEVIHTGKEDFSKRVEEMTHGKGVEVVFEHVGSETWEKSLQALAKGGRLVTCGATTGSDVQLNIRFLFSRQLSLLGSIMGTRKELKEVIRLVEEGKLRPIIDKSYPLQDARLAQERMLNRDHFGKILLLPELK